MEQQAGVGARTGLDVEATVVVDRSTDGQWSLALEDGRTFDLWSASVVVGRRPRQVGLDVQTLAIPDRQRTLSKTHARLDLVDGTWQVTDLGSTNGVMVTRADGQDVEVARGGVAPVYGYLQLGTLGARIVPTAQADGPPSPARQSRTTTPLVASAVPQPPPGLVRPADEPGSADTPEVAGLPAPVTGPDASSAPEARTERTPELREVVPAGPPLPVPDVVSLSAPAYQPAADQQQPVDQPAAAPVLDPAAPAGPATSGPDEGDAEVTATKSAPPFQAWTLALADGRTFSVGSRSVVVGRRPQTDGRGAQVLAVADPTRSLSKTHALLELVDGTWHVTDLGSTNGVVVTAADGQETRAEPGQPAPVYTYVAFGSVEARLHPGSTG